MDTLIDRFARLTFPALGALAVTLGCGDDSAAGGKGGAGGAGTGATSTQGGGPSNCFTDEIGTCCTNPVCFSHEQVDALLAQAAMGGAGGIGGTSGTGGAGGAGGAAAGGGQGGGAASLACPDGSQLPWDVCESYAGAPPPGEMCCYDYTTGDCCGRPFLVGGAARVAPLVEGDAWCGPQAPADVDARLAEEWLADARLEHASIAAFARFTLQLLELGAPPDLVAAAQRAGLDELAHARSCYALAARFGGVAVGPGPLDLGGALAPLTLPELAALVVREGCVGETLAAALADAQLARAEDAEVRAALERIARDEADHAELAWRFVAWAVAGGGTPVAAAARAALHDEIAGLATTPIAEDEPAPARAALHRFGRLTPGERRAVRSRALAAIVAPCAARLFGAVEVARPAQAFSTASGVFE